MSDWDWRVPLKCYQCGRDVYVEEKQSWAYKRDFTPCGRTHGKTKYFCSWSCVRQYDREHGEKKVVHNARSTTYC